MGKTEVKDCWVIPKAPNMYYIESVTLNTKPPITIDVHRVLGPGDSLEIAMDQVIEELKG